MRDVRKAPDVKTLFVTSGNYTWASSRLRAYWPGFHMGADVMPLREIQDFNIDAYEAYIFQKVYNFDLARAMKAAGKKVVWDVCDPSWWWEPQAATEAFRLSDAIVACTEALADDLLDWEGTGSLKPEIRKVSVIPDRMELTCYPKQAQHDERTPVRLIWYGIAFNRIALFAALANLERLAVAGASIELTLFDDRPDIQEPYTRHFPIKYEQWTTENENDIIAAHDIALLPPYPGPWGRVKSPNKRLTAWACGLPATTGERYDELYDLVHSVEMRATLGRVGRKQIEKDWRAEQSADEWKALLCGLI